jgi:thiol-disulfide isomerase/thioredoxin
MRALAFLQTLLVALAAGAQTPAGAIWADLTAVREKLPSLHQEFDVSHTYLTAKESQASKRQIVLDMSHGQWRELSVTGSGNRVRMFDGKDLFSMDEGGSEFVRAKRRPKEENPSPSPYSSVVNADWPKAVELERRPCGIPGRDHACVALQVPLKAWSNTTTSGTTRMLEGTARLVLDTETGMLVALSTLQKIDDSTGQYQSSTVYLLKRTSYGAPADAALFQLPSAAMREVKELSSWDAAKIRKQLAGKPAPALAVTDIQGKPVTLSAFQGKIVLLDFWTTWCAPCRADGPALDKLYARYGGQELTIVGISVSEDRAVVEKFLHEHPHSYPIVLTTENEMPPPYRIGRFPTYIAIGRDGAVIAAVEGDQGFADLRNLLKKADVETD